MEQNPIEKNEIKVLNKNGCYSQFRKPAMNGFYIVFLIILSFNCYGQNTKKDLNSEMARLKTETVLIVNSQAIDEYPLWSPNSDFVSCNIEDKWYKFRLTDIDFAEATWRGQTIGVLTTEDAYSELSSKEQAEFEKVSKFNPRKVKTRDGTQIELKTEGISVSLIVTRKGQKPEKLWTSDFENCHSLVLSPNEKYVAYLCELNGLLIMKLK